MEKGRDEMLGEKYHARPGTIPHSYIEMQHLSEDWKELWKNRICGKCQFMVLWANF